MSNAPLSLSLGDFETAAPQRSTCNAANPVDYKKFFQGKAAAVKTNSSVLLNSSHSEASRMLFNYTLSHPKKQATHDFIHVARKKTNLSTPDMPSIKDALRSDEADVWRKVIKIEYKALIANDTWILLDCPKDQHGLTGKWAFKRKIDINGNIKKYKACWARRGFQQQERIDYFETYTSVIKSVTNKALFAIIAHKCLHSHQCDTITALLNSQLWEKIYIEYPKFF